MTPEDLLALAERGAPLSQQRDGLTRALAAQHVSPDGIAAVLDRVRDAVVLRAGGGGRSRFGGPGLLPVGETWPIDPRGVPLSLIAAVDLDELPDLDPLPRDGWLLFYWDFEFFELERMDWLVSSRVFWVPPNGALEQPANPGGSAAPSEPVPLLRDG